jgi:hypothetical protein
MDSPFPGMEPYLENTDFWPGFHNGFMHYVQDELQSRLPENYIATLDMRVYYYPEQEEGKVRTQRVPDVELVRTGPALTKAHAEDTATPARGTLLELDPVEVREAHISLKELPSGRLVTSVELLSPDNKSPGPGRQSYLNKQWELYGLGVNLVELDFLRGGLNTLLVSSSRLAGLCPFHYLAGVFRAFDPLQYEVVTWTVRDPLPTISVPLDEALPGVSLDLGQVFRRTFVTGAFRRVLGYSRKSSPTLAPEDEEWADALLREAGLRGTTSA